VLFATPLASGAQQPQASFSHLPTSPFIHLSSGNHSDGTAGGEVLEGNLIFNGVRESGDHGMFNSWCVAPAAPADCCIC